jgi:two-component system response regulator VanR
VEDDPNISGMAERFLSKEGYSTECCANGEEALARIYERAFDLILLDIMLPGMSGQEILKELRKLHDTPVLMMTALSDDENQLRAFELCADDYIKKPFSMQILVKRAEALLRRSGALKETIRAGRLTLFPETCSVQCGGKSITLTPKEFEILKLLAMNKGRIIRHETMLVRIWGYDFDGNEGIIHASLKKIRDKLPPGLIRTVKGLGYVLEVDDEGN